MKNSFWLHAAAVLIVAVWGLTFISTRVLLDAGLVPCEIFVLRFVIAYAGIWLMSPRRLFADSLKDELMMAVVGLTGGSIYFWAENTALLYTQASNVSFIVCTTPLVTAVLSILLSRLRGGSEHWTWPLAVGSIVAIAGIGLIVFNGQVVLHLSPLGDALAMAASLLWAFYTLVIRSLSGRYPSAFITRKVFFYGLLTILPVFAVQPWQFPLAGLRSLPVLLNVLFLGVVASLICYAAWTPIIKRLGTIKASNYIYLNPLFTLAGAVIVLGERVTVFSGMGAVLILLGVWLAGRKLN